MLAYARELQASGYFSRAHTTLLEGVKVLSKCVEEQPKLVSLWKLLGDLYSFHYHVPQKFDVKMKMLKEGINAYHLQIFFGCLHVVVSYVGMVSSMRVCCEHSDFFWRFGVCCLFYTAT